MCSCLGRVVVVCVCVVCVALCGQFWWPIEAFGRFGVFTLLVVCRLEW